MTLKSVIGRYRVKGVHLEFILKGGLCKYQKNYKGLGMTEKEKKQEETQTG